jgi:acetyl-CoA carboxylase biotin carboxyl carrier protein
MNMKDVRQLGARLANTAKAKSPMNIDGAAIRELAELLDETGLGEIEIEQGGRRIRIARQAPSIQAAPTPSLPTISEPVVSPPPTQQAAPPRRDAEDTITSPMVGTVYVAPEPGKPPFVSVGDTVREGDTLLIVEAMKTMNPIVAPHVGVVSEICVQDAEPVEFGQALIVLSSVGA